jgi:hypothetical protein
MKTYHVKFSHDGEGELETQVRSYRVASVIRAFERCLKEYPGARLIEAWREGWYLDGYGFTIYQPPSFVKVEAEPALKEEQMMLNLN